MDHDYDPDEIPNHHLPRSMSDFQNPSAHPNHPNMSDHSGHLSHPNMADLNNNPSGHPLRSNSKMSDLQNHSGRHNGHHRPPTPKMADLENPSGHHQYQNNHHHNGPPPPHHQQYTGSRPLQFPSPLPPPAGKHKRRQPQYSPPPPQPYGHHDRRQSSKAGAFAAIATLVLLLALTALILYLVYRPKTPHFTVVAASIYLLNSTAAPPPTASFLAATIQLTVVTRNPHRHTSLDYDHLTAQLFYRDQPITPPSALPPLHHTHHTTVVFSPVLGGGEPVPVAPGVVEGLAADEIYGVMGLRLAIMGRVRYKAGIIKSAHYGVYVVCDVLIGVKKAVVGPVPLLANHDCKVDM